MQPFLSVIIPTFNEERQIAAAIASVRQAAGCEVIVCDGNSTDNTRAESREADTFLQAPRGRATQQNAGARIAAGEVLWFLHADCRATPGFDEAIRRALNDPGYVGGCFSQQIDHPRRLYRLIEHGNRARVQNLGWIYGDQGFFVRREIFWDLGGFPEQPLMEDLYLSKRLRRRGRLAVLDEKIVVSARRWERRGPVRQTLRNWGFIALASAGVPLKTLAAWYGHVRDDDSP